MAVHDRRRPPFDKGRDIREMDLFEQIIFELKCIRMHMEALTGIVYEKEEIE